MQATSARRDELNGAVLAVAEGAFPADLRGHVFIVAPVGNVGTPGFDPGGAQTILNGDGMVTRIDLSREDARVTSRLMRTSDFYADEAVANGAGGAGMGFVNAGMFRMSPRLGSRNFANTGLVPFRAGGARTRLLATYDGGRPVEIDPVTLDVVTSVGALDQWRAISLPNAPFPPILSAAHPAVDDRTGELYFVNYGRSLRGILGGASALSGPVARGLGALAERASRAVMPRATPTGFVTVARWDGHGRLRPARLVDASRAPIEIEQTVHQVCVTEDYLLVFDTSMKVTPVQVLGVGGPLRRMLTSAQQVGVPVYIVRRADLRAGLPDVVATQVTLPLEAVHAWTDYANPGGRIALHVAHTCAMDVGEWVRPHDINHFTRAPVDPEFVGIPHVSPLDVSRLARYVINAERPAIEATEVVSDEATTWGISLSTGPGLDTDTPSERVRSLFHVSPGFAPELMTEHLFELYRDYAPRLVPLERIEAIGRNGGIPGAIVHLDADRMAIVDSFTLPPRSVAGSIQFVPAPGHPGYVLATAIHDGRRQLWVLRADDLASGPVCKLEHPQWRFGPTLHAAWLPRIESRNVAYRISVADDEGAMATRSPALRALFRDHVLPHFA